METIHKEKAEKAREKAIADQFEARRAKNKSSRARKLERRETRLAGVCCSRAQHTLLCFPSIQNTFAVCQRHARSLCCPHFTHTKGRAFEHCTRDVDPYEGFLIKRGSLRRLSSMKYVSTPLVPVLTSACFDCRDCPQPQQWQLASQLQLRRHPSPLRSRRTEQPHG